MATILEPLSSLRLCAAPAQSSNQNLSLYSLYYAEACYELVGPHLPVIAPEHSTFRNVIAVPSRWKNRVRYDRLQI